MAREQIEKRMKYPIHAPNAAPKVISLNITKIS
jgi:hypothetical protein